MTPTGAVIRGARATAFSAPTDTVDRGVQRRVALAWVLLLLNVLTFFPWTWSGEPLLIHIPSVVGKLITQGALPGALLVLLTVNRRLVVRRNIFLCLASLLVIEAIMTTLQGVHIGVIYRTLRLGGFVSALWLLTPYWSRRDLLLLRVHLTALLVALATVLAGFVVAPGRAMAGGRLSGVFWPIAPTQVAHFAAVATGVMVVRWFAGRARGIAVAAVSAVAMTTLVLSHTRTALLAMMAGVFVAGLSLFISKARVRKLFAISGVIASGAAVSFSAVATTWLARGQNSSQLTGLTGRTSVWQGVESIPRDRFQVLFGFGLSNKSYNGAGIDSTWFSAYYDLGLIGIAICAIILLSLLATSYLRQAGERRALALFLVTFLLVSSFTEDGLSDASVYFLELALAASLLAPAAVDG